MILDAPFAALGLLAVLAVAAYAVAAWPAAWPAGQTARWASWALTLGWLAHALLLVLEVSGLGRADGVPRLGFGPVLSITVWLVLAVHAVESRWLPLPTVRRALAVAGALAVLLAWAYPGDWRLQSANAWAPLHWLLGVGSYGLFGAAVLHAHWLDRAEHRLRLHAAGSAPASGMPLLRLERLTFRFVQAGFVVLSAALVLGVATAGHLRVDHKTVFSVLGWAVFAALLAGRHWRGWRGRRATRWLYAGAVLLLLAYAGSRFVFEVVLGRSAA